MSNYEKLLPVARLLCISKNPEAALNFLLQAAEQEIKAESKGVSV